METKIAKWPFFAGDLVLLALGGFLCYYPGRTGEMWQITLGVFCIISAAAFGIAPYILDYRSSTKLQEAGALASVVSQIRDLEAIAEQIQGATGQWQTAQEQAEKTAAAARQIAEQMAAEAKGFGELMEKMSDREKAALRLEVDKFRRAETEWLQVLVRMFDHVYALHVGTLRSSQPHLIEQVGNFQSACRDAARRIGLAPFTAAEAEPFDGQRHQLVDEKVRAEPGATVAETIAAGYTFQGRLLRPALVRLRNGNGERVTDQAVGQGGE